MSLYPNKETRNKCYTARDSLWNCLDRNNDNKDLCQQFRKQFETQCPQQWVRFLKYYLFCY